MHVHAGDDNKLEDISYQIRYLREYFKTVDDVPRVLSIVKYMAKCALNLENVFPEGLKLLVQNVEQELVLTKH